MVDSRILLNDDTFLLTTSTTGVFSIRVLNDSTFLVIPSDTVTDSTSDMLKFFCLVSKIPFGSNMSGPPKIASADMS